MVCDEIAYLLSRKTHKHGLPITIFSQISLKIWRASVIRVYGSYHSVLSSGSKLWLLLYISLLQFVHLIEGVLCFI